MAPAPAWCSGSKQRWPEAIPRRGRKDNSTSTRTKISESAWNWSRGFLMPRKRLFIDLLQARFSLPLGSARGDAGDLLESFAGCSPTRDLVKGVSLHLLDQ